MESVQFVSFQGLHSFASDLQFRSESDFVDLVEVLFPSELVLPLLLFKRSLKVVLFGDQQRLFVSRVGRVHHAGRIYDLL